MTNNVTPLRGAAVTPPPMAKEPHKGTIELLERLLQEARAGDIVGIVCAYHSPDWRAGYTLTGFVGGFSMQGALHCALSDLADINRGMAEDDD